MVVDLNTGDGVSKHDSWYPRGLRDQEPRAAQAAHTVVCCIASQIDVATRFTALRRRGCLAAV